MRVNAVTVGSWTAFTIIGILIGLFAHQCRQCPPDGNPISYRLEGAATLTDNGFTTSCKTKSCVLTFDIRTNENGAVANVATCGSSNCFHFKNDGTGKWRLDMKDAQQHNPYFDYVDGTVTYVAGPVKP